MPRLPGFIGGSYTLQSVPIDCQRCVNLYPQITESQNQADGEIGALISAPGKRLLGVCGSGPCRGIYVASTGGMIIVSGREVYRVGYSWAFTKIGDLVTSTGPLGISDNGTQILIVDGPNGYIVSLVTATLTKITGDWFAGANTAPFSDGYFIMNNPGTGQFFWSNLYDGLNGDALNFITAEGSPDATVGVLANQRQIWVMGAKTIEVFWNSGSDTTFNRIDGAFVEYGCAAAATAQKFANSIIWLGDGPNARGIVWQAIGYQPKRISNHAVEYAIQGYGDISTATAWTYQENGHAFYILNFPSANASWCYDISTGQWHERCALGTDGNFTRDRAECYAFGFSEHVVGDYENGNIYALDNATFTDNARPKKWLRRAPHLSANGHRVFYSLFQLFARVGTGLDGAVTYATDPTVELRYSDDFGNTWSTPKARSLGKLGAYATRVIWRQLGSSRNRVFEVSGSDPVAISLLGAEIQATPGGS